jgi:drug/metabolite transporter (DMT)-like permease
VPVPAAFVALVLLWGTTPLAIRWSSEGGGPLFGVAARMVLGVLLCLALTAILGRRLAWDRPALLTYGAAGLGVWGAMTGVYWAAQVIPTGLVSVIFGLTPLVTALMAALWLGERALTPPRLAGLAACLAGLWTIFGQGELRLPALGLAVALVSVAIHSASSVWVKRIDAGLHPLETATGALLVAVPLFVLDWAVLDGQPPVSLPPRALWSILYLAALGSALGFILYYDLLRRVQASRVALIPLLTPVLALLVGQALNGETVSPSTALGTAVVLGGLAVFHWGDLWAGRASPAARVGSARYLRSHHGDAARAHRLSGRNLHHRGLRPPGPQDPEHR